MCFFVQGCLSFGSNFCFGRDNLAFPTCAEKSMEPVISPIDFLSGTGLGRGSAGYATRAAARLLARKKFIENGEMAVGYITIFCQKTLEANRLIIRELDLQTFSVRQLTFIEKNFLEALEFFARFREKAIEQINEYSLSNGPELLRMIDEIISIMQATLLRVQRTIIEISRNQPHYIH